jgi:hypothetical protein
MITADRLFAMSSTNIDVYSCHCLSYLAKKTIDENGNNFFHENYQVLIFQKFLFHRIGFIGLPDTLAKYSFYPCDQTAVKRQFCVKTQSKCAPCTWCRCTAASVPLLVEFLRFSLVLRAIPIGISVMFSWQRTQWDGSTSTATMSYCREECYRGKRGEYRSMTQIALVAERREAADVRPKRLLRFLEESRSRVYSFLIFKTGHQIGFSGDGVIVVFSLCMSYRIVRRIDSFLSLSRGDG